MAGVVSKLSERDMLLLYFARAMHEYLELPTGNYWSDVLARSGVQVITANVLCEWSQYNLYEEGFHCDGVKGLMRHLREKRMDPRRPGLFATVGCQQIREGLDMEGHPECNGDEESYADDENDLNWNGSNLVVGKYEVIMIHYKNCMQLSEDGFLFGINSDSKDTYGYWKTKSLTAEIIADEIDSEGLTIVDKLVDEDWWKKFLTPKCSSVKELKLDTLAYIGNNIWEERSVFDISSLPDKDQYCAVFICHQLLWRCSSGIYFGNARRFMVRKTIKDLVKDGYLVGKRSVNGWYKWFVDELFHNPSGCNYFNVNASALCHLQYEVLRSGRGDNYAGISKLQRLDDLLVKGSNYKYYFVY